MGARRATLRHEARLARIRVGHVQLAAGALNLVLGHRANRGAGDRRLVIGAVDGDGDLFRRAVEAGDGQRVGQLLAGFQRLNRRLAIVERIAPGAVGLNREAAMGARRATLRHEARLARIRVGHVQLAAGALNLVLGHRALRCTGDHCTIIGAHHVHDQLVARSIHAMDREGFTLALPRDQRLDRWGIVVERVGPMT
ncbi:hypothetical protein TRL7639_03625 [Falsiruegeria litorea R37]|uniref:Uncharacterized protein n=1 Tax=Falsiruegeria litorea R37 TaxID=1200284 RepID=A0A1Y5TH23_9RHOB|nr:hypothetical protein TRL7639_03625 [Falsiruegeria litorea R37]